MSMLRKFAPPVIHAKTIFRRFLLFRNEFRGMNKFLLTQPSSQYSSQYFHITLYTCAILHRFYFFFLAFLALNLNANTCCLFMQISRLIIWCLRRLHTQTESKISKFLQRLGPVAFHISLRNLFRMSLMHNFIRFLWYFCYSYSNPIWTRDLLGLGLQIVWQKKRVASEHKIWLRI